MEDPKNGVMHRADWVTLRDYVDARFSALALNTEQVVESLTARLDSMNEFRASLSDQSAHFITREEYGIAHRMLEEEARLSRDFRSSQQGKASTGQLWLVSIVSIIGVILGLAHLLLK
jgi:hypothetical protein